LSIGAIGDFCSGRGQCVNGECICDAGWTGRGDIFSLDKFACTTPIALEITFYAILCLGFLHLGFKAAPTFIYQKRKYFQLRREKLSRGQ
jgi:hypothetical protein